MLSTHRFTSSDALRVEETWNQFVPSAALQRIDPARFRFDWRSAQTAGVTLAEYELAAEVRSVVAPEDQLLVCRVESSRVELGSGSDVIDPDVPWLTDGRQVWARWEGTARVRALIFDRDVAQEMARQMTGDDTYRLHVKDLRPVAGSADRWERAFGYLAESFACAESDDVVIVAELRRHALWATLTAFDTGFAEALERATASAPAPAAVRRAIAFIDENAHSDITVDDVARAVHMSSRGLQYAFRRALGTTPAEQLRRARLDGAHRELLRGDGTTVTRIARTWGFAHPSRFAAAYREVYGVTPSETRRRVRGD